MERERIIPDNIRKLLTEGLQAGYAGKAEKDVVYRGPAGFDMDASSYETKEGDWQYHDEWVNGGGQELVNISSEEKEWTRTYSGSTARPELLKSLGIAEKDVTKYLKRKIRELGDRTRLDQDCFPEADGDWRYFYLAVQYPEIPAVDGIEKIEFKEKLVFIHLFGIAPVK